MPLDHIQPRTLKARVPGLLVAALVLGLILTSTAAADPYPTYPQPHVATPAKPSGKWAHTRVVSAIRGKPSTKSRRVGHLRLLTEDGFPEVYRILKQQEVGDTTWVRIGIPARPNGQTGWVQASRLGEIKTTYRLLKINRRGFTAKLWENRPNGIRRLVWQARVGVGAVGTETPRGNFWVREKIKGFQGGSIYGYMAFGTSAYSKLSDWPGGGVVGIHGTNEPWLIPGAVSHGCIRVKDPDVRKLSKKLSIGTPVEIR